MEADQPDRKVALQVHEKDPFPFDILADPVDAVEVGQRIAVEDPPQTFLQSIYRQSLLEDA
jgi:hypothetical protein